MCNDLRHRNCNEIQTELGLRKSSKQFQWLKIDHMVEIIQEICLENLQQMKIKVAMILIDIFSTIFPKTYRLVISYQETFNVN